MHTGAAHILGGCRLVPRFPQKYKGGGGSMPPGSVEKGVQEHDTANELSAMCNRRRALTDRRPDHVSAHVLAYLFCSHKRWSGLGWAWETRGFSGA